MLQRFAVLLCAALLTVACGQSDAGISTAIKSKFVADDMVKAYEIDVDTDNRVVTLTGEVATSIAKDQALKLARETDGVRDVVDKLSVADTAATSGVLDREDDDVGDKAAAAADRAGVVVTDAAITSAVKAKLLADTTVGGLKIDVDTTEGVVTLTGDVASKTEANEAVRLARGTDGVRSVVDRLRVTTR